MTTKDKCNELARSFKIEVWAFDKIAPHGYMLCLPEGLQLGEHDDRTGLSAYGAETQGELWRAVYKDLQECVSLMPWFRANNANN